LALGATKNAIFGAVLRQSGFLIAAGSILGVAGALSGARILRSMLHGVQPNDLAVTVAAPLLLAAAALLACAIPASRAASVDPMTALREE
jgi:putative ABC transport system permease protein